MHKLYGLTILYFLGVIIVFPGCSPKNPLALLINNDPFLKTVSNDTMHEVQVLYTRVNKNSGKFKNYMFRVNSEQYFYPASTVKLPVAILTLQKINELQESGIDVNIDDDMLTAQNRVAQSPAFSDSTTTSGKPNIRRYTEKLFAVSDNDAYNRLYEFLGADYINQSLNRVGLNQGTIINHRVGVTGYDYEENRHTNHIRFFREGRMVFDKAAIRDKMNWKHNAKNAKKGIGYLDKDGKLVQDAFDFSMKNFYSLTDMHGTIMRIFYPEKFKPEERFNLTSDDIVFLRRVMSSPPSFYPFYESDTSYHDHYVKFLFHGASEKSDAGSDFLIYNKVGNAYGYLIDCAYIEDKLTANSFFLTAVIHVNQNKIYNDGMYEYDSIGYPFLARLGKKILEYERRQKN